MANKNEIKAALLQSLNSPVWQKAKNALVGQELLSWGTEVIYALQQQREAIENIYNTSIADLQDIIRLSNTSIPTVQIADPSYIVLRSALVDSKIVKTLGVTQDTIVEPFEMSVQSGSVKFYNVNYLNLKTTDNDDIRLYQGKPICAYYCSESIPTENKLDIAKSFSSNVTPVSKEFSQTWVENGLYSNFISIGKNVLVDSIQVWYVQNNTLKLMHAHDPLETGPDDLSYKLYITPSGEYYVIFGNGVNAHFVSDEDQVYITYLELTNSAFDENCKVILKNLSPVSLSSEDSNDMILYYAENFQSKERALIDVNKKIAMRSTLSTESQIIAFMKSFNEIIDCAVVSKVSGSGSSRYDVGIYVIPRVAGYEDLTYILHQLNMRASLIYNFVLKTPKAYEGKVYFKFQNTSQAVHSSEVESYLNNMLSITNTYFGLVIYTSTVTSMVLNDLGYNIELVDSNGNSATTFFKRDYGTSGAFEASQSFSFEKPSASGEGSIFYITAEYKS